jgi:uncharacterized protein (TIGR03663 family)
MNSISHHSAPLDSFSGRERAHVGLNPIIRWAVFTVLAVLALVVRLPQLGDRPMHNDEAVNACITGNLLGGEAFHYDPQDRHGPMLYLIGKPVARLLGSKNLAELTETKLRLSTVITGAATVLLFGAGVEMFGFITCLCAALLFAFTPLPIYYNRYYIHESLFVLTTLGFILSSWRMQQTRSLTAGALTGLCAAMMLACKETAVIHFATIITAIVLCHIGSHLSSIKKERAVSSLIRTSSLAAGIFIIASVVLFTWFGRNWNVFSDLFQAIGRFAERAGGEGHEKPVSYYFHLLGKTPGLLSLAALGSIVATWKFFQSADYAKGFCLFCAVGTFLFYCFIPYKTPWLGLSLLLPMSMLVGSLFETLWALFNPRRRFVFLICAGIVCSAFFSAQFKPIQKWCFTHSSDEANPYAYAHTSEDLLRLPDKLTTYIQNNQLTNPLIAVVASDPWPLPWYLRKFSRVGYWLPGQGTGDADLFITTTDISEALSERLKAYRPQYFGARPGVLLVLWTPEKRPSTHE